MTRFALVAAVLACATALSHAADPPKDTLAASFTRTKKLKGKVTVDFKNETLRDCFTELSSQLEDQKLGALIVTSPTSVPLTTRVTFAAKDVTAEVAIDGLLKPLDLGYYVVSKEKDRSDGWLTITKGPARGYPTAAPVPKTEAKKPDEKPEEKKATEEDETMAAGKLALAKQLLGDKKDERAKTVLKFIVKHFPNTKAGAEAKELLGKADK